MNGNFIQRFFNRFWMRIFRWVESGNTSLAAAAVSKPRKGRIKTQTQLHHCANTVCKFINEVDPAWHPKLERGHETIHPPGGRAECQFSHSHACRRGGPRGSNEPPLEVNNGGLKTQTVDFQLLANSGGMENKLWVLQLLNYPARKR